MTHTPAHGFWNGQPCAILRRTTGPDGTKLVTIQTGLNGPVQRVLTVPETTYDKAQAAHDKEKTK